MCVINTSCIYVRGVYYVQFVSVCEFYVWDVLERVCVCV